MEIYMVGGCVRDEILGRPSKDIDYSVVLSESDMDYIRTMTTGMTPYDFMVSRLEREGNRIIRNDKTGAIIGAEHMTVRAIHPKRGAVDYVLARKDGEYSDGRRPDSVEIGTLQDDLARRDFTMNAIAKNEFGEYIDPFNGRQDINDRVIRAVGSAFDRFTEDALRAVRALRFSVTLGFRIDTEVEFAMESAAVLDRIKNKSIVADERIKDEVNKMLSVDILGSFAAFGRYPALTAALFDGRVSLEATMKERK